MLDWLRYRNELRRLGKERKRMAERHISELTKYTDENPLTPEEFEPFRRETAILDARVASTISSYLFSQARKLFITIPDSDWENREDGGYYCLTDEAMMRLRSAIREE